MTTETTKTPERRTVAHPFFPELSLRAENPTTRTTLQPVPRKKSAPADRTCGECSFYRERWTARDGQKATCECKRVHDRRRVQACPGDEACSHFEAWREDV